MELLDYPIQLRAITDKVFIHIFGDIHRAARGCDVHQLHSDINQVKHANDRKNGEHHYWIGLGDWMNAISGKDKRHDSTAISEQFQPYQGRDLFGAEAAALVGDFQKIADRGIGIMGGNHESSISKYHETDHAATIARRLDLPHLGYSCLVRFRLIHDSGKTKRGATVVAYFHHGYGAARTKGAKVNKLYSFRDNAEADVYVCGHDHELSDFPDSRLSIPRRGKLRLVEKQRLFVNGGTYLKAS